MRAISLADVAFTKALSWAADGLNPRLRLQAELERLRREISLLGEWVALAVDHFARRVMGFAVYRGEPTSEAIRGFLQGVFRRTGQQPRHLISDQGIQFTARAFQRWCRRRGICHRFGAVGKYGSLAVIERSIRTFKTECTRRLILVPYGLAAFRRELGLYFS
jgi:transposase InsO family protein